MAPALMLARQRSQVDLDGPLLQSFDYANPMTYINGAVQLLLSILWY